MLHDLLMVHAASCRMGFGQLQIENGTLLVLGDHVEVQMRLVEGCLCCSERVHH